MEFNFTLSIIGQWHVVLVHFPVALLVLAAMWDIAVRSQRMVTLRPALPLLYAIGTLSALAATVTGWILAGEGNYATDLVRPHQWLGAVTVVTAGGITYALHRFGLPRWIHRRVTLVAPLILAALVGLTGHLGGSLTHGPDFLVADTSPRPLAPLMDSSVVYAALITPVFEQHCVDCHGASRRKGGIRLDAPTHLSATGHSHHALLPPGAPASGELLRRLMLPATATEHMPPPNRPPLSESELALVRWWIVKGADTQATLAELSPSASIQEHLAVLTQQGTPATVQPATGAPDPQAIRVLREAGAQVQAEGSGEPFLSVSFVGSLPDQAPPLELLRPLARHIVRLRLSGQQFDRADLRLLSKLEGLEMLYLDRTNITDTDLEYLQRLPRLRYLNLTGTEVTAAGARPLRQLASLRQLFLDPPQTQPPPDQQEVAAIQISH